MEDPQKLAGQISQAVAFARQALAVVDTLPDCDLAANHLQQAIDQLDDHQSRHPPRA